MANVSAETSLAIDAFRQREKVAHILERKERDLANLVRRIPQDELPEYVTRTTNIEKQHEAKCEICNPKPRLRLVDA